MASISVGLLLAVGLLLSCGPSAPVGTFRGSRNEVGRPGADPVVLAQINRVTLKIDADGNANLEDGGIPWEGRVSRSGDELEFDVAAINGVNIERQPTDLSRKLKLRVASENELEYGGVRLERVPTH